MKREDKKNWYLIGTIHDIPRQGAQLLQFGDRQLGIFRTYQDEFYAINAQCPHAGGPLTEGLIHGHYVSCPLHDWTINLKTGICQAPDEGQVSCYPLLIDGEDIWIALQEK
ncbi:MAG: nitrite reductase small subunit NirD [Oligoflexus sp.]